MNIGESIRNQRESRNLSRNDVEEMSGVNFRYLGEVERGERSPGIETLIKIANAFDITVSELIGESESKLSEEQRKLIDNAKNLNPTQIEALINVINAFSNKSIYRPTYDELSFVAEKPVLWHNQGAGKTISLLGYVAAGKPIEAIENIIGEIELTDERFKDTDFALQVKGDSMEPLIKDGQVVYVQKQEEAETGEIIVAYLNGDVTCKKLYRHNGEVELRAINPKYDPIIINKGDFKLIGKVLI